MEKIDLIINEFDLVGIKLPESSAEKFSALYEFLIEYNKNVNLTAITDFEEVVIKHFIDSVLPFSMINISGNETIIDVGTGAGFPALPLLICYPNLRATLCDSLAKRCAYLEKACREIGVTAEIIHSRAEELAQKRREKYDISTARAVAAMPVLTELCLPFVKIGGKFIALKSVNENISAAQTAAQTLGGEIKKITDYSLPRAAGERRLAIIEKLSPTPNKYPRPYAKISKNPL